MKGKILVTGATGFVGANLVRHLVQQGRDVRILVRKNSHHPFLEGLQIERVEGELNDPGQLCEACANCDTVFHLAVRISFNRQDYAQTYETNVSGTRHILRAALNADVKKFVHVSSCAAIGVPNASQELLNENAVFPEEQKRASYPYSKWLAEQEVFPFVTQGLNASIANLSTVYGAGDKTLNSGSIIKLVYKYPVFCAPPGGCSLIAVEDVISGLISLAEKGKAGERYILTGENKTYQEVFDTIAQVVKNKRITKVLPAISRFPMRLTARFIERISTHLGLPSKLLTEDVVMNLFFYRYLDNKKAKQELGWQPKTDLKTAVKEAFEFYKTQKML